jgi:hypothetical protein
MAQQAIENLRFSMKVQDARKTGLEDARDTHKIPLAIRKAGRATKDKARCRFCVTGPILSSSKLAKHTMQAHGDAVRYLDNSKGSMTLFELGNSVGGQKGMYMMNRAFYNILQHFGVIDTLPSWTDLREIKFDSKVQLLAGGNPIVDERSLVKQGESCMTPDFALIDFGGKEPRVNYTPTESVNSSEEFSPTEYVVCSSENDGVYEKDVLI